MFNLTALICLLVHISFESHLVQSPQGSDKFQQVIVHNPYMDHYMLDYNLGQTVKTPGLESDMLHNNEKDIYKYCNTCNGDV